MNRNTLNQGSLKHGILKHGILKQPRALFLLGLMPVFIALFAPASMNAQVVLSTVSGSTETPITGGSFNFGTIAPLTTEDVTFRARGTGSAAVTITELALSGIGFEIVNTSTLPVTIAAGNSFDFFVRFTGGPVGSFSANLQVNTVVVALQGSVAQTSTLTVATPCTGPDAQNNISFGRIPQTTQTSCVFTLSNPYTQALTISPITLTGAAFQTVQGASAAIPAGQAVTFTVTFMAATASTFTATLVVGVQTYFLSGTGYLNPLPAPILTFDVPTLHSNEQHTLTAALSAPAPAAANGSITLGFTSSVGSVTNDTGVDFVATGNRSVSFSVAAGATTMLLNNQTGVIFSTGTTAGTITFTVNAGAIGLAGGATTTVTLAPSPVFVAAGSATNPTGSLDVTLSGFDNTYSIGAMTFTFYDTSGKTLGAPIQANFSQPFQLFYQSESPGGVSPGSAFLMLVSFPVTGNEAAVGSVVVQLTNTAGSTTIAALDFPP